VIDVALYIAMIISLLGLIDFDTDTDIDSTRLDFDSTRTALKRSTPRHSLPGHHPRT
ncbi:hypothetical protein OC844_008043, partial [Tilletia horrida]